MKNITKTSMAVLAASALLLSGCGAGTNDGASGSAKDGEKIEIKSSDYLKVDYADLKEGGTLTLGLGEVTEQLNTFHADGTADTSNIWAWYNPQIALFDDEGEWYANPAYITDVKEDVVDGKTVITYTINKDAKWNDGDPLTWKAFEATWKVNNGKDATNFPSGNTGGYKQIESVEQGANEKVAVVTFDTTFPWWKQTFESLYNPKAATPETFKTGYIKNAHPEWGAGPYKLESIDFNGGNVTFVPNENWWGDKPKLERVTLVAKDAAAEMNAFKNKEVDAVGIGSADRLAQVAGLDDISRYTAPSLGLTLLQLNADAPKMKDIKVRQALFHAVDRETLFKIRFKGINYTEDLVGSLLLKPTQKSYQDNLGELGKFDLDKAKSLLDEAGWKLEDGKEYRTKDGEELKVLTPVFGTSPTSKALYGALQSMFKSAGVELILDQRTPADFQKTMAEKSFDLSLSGFLASNPFGMGDLGQIYRSDSELSKTGLGSKELDEEITKSEHQPTEDKAIALGNEAEKKALAQAGWLPLYVGPAMVATREGLANLGAMGFTKIPKEHIGWKK